ncbi:MAG: cysteine desulfurase family protein [Patescibacteria group bacterium]
MNRIYLDYAATTPVDPRVVRAMKPYFSDVFGNPSSLHYFGQQALAALDASREAVADALHADFREIIFTGSATESNNLALRGTIRSAMQDQKFKPRIIISAIEHESVRETARDLERDGAEIVEIPVDRHGFADLKKLEAALNERTVLVSIIYANNEIGTVQPIAEISKVIRNFCDGPRVKGQVSRFPLFHTDAVQAFQFLPCVPSELGVDLMTISAHKIYGPKGIGALYARVTGHGSRITSSGLKKISSLTHDPCSLTPTITGGGQEFGLRSGTENVPSVIGFAKAVQIVSSARDRECARILKIRDYFWKKLKGIAPRAELNSGIKYQVSGVREEKREIFSLPNILNVYFPETNAEHLITKLDLLGVAVSSGSACHTRASQSSHVLEALGFSKEHARQCIRFSFGRPTTQAHIAAALKKIKNNIKILKSCK